MERNGTYVVRPKGEYQDDTNQQNVTHFSAPVRVRAKDGANHQIAWNNLGQL